jgi:protein subunit release factor B
MSPDAPADPREALVTIRAGTGVDAADFAEMLLRMYLRWAERHGYAVDVHETVHSEASGITATTFQVRAPFAHARLSAEQGTHRLVRISPHQDDGRRQTSFVEVEVSAVSEADEPVPGDTGSPWGEQIRSYVLQPFRMVKDLRSGHQVDDPTAVLDGEIDDFLEAGIRRPRGNPR